MKRILALLITLTMFCSLFTGVNVFASTNPSFVVSTAVANPGETVTINVGIANNPGITALQVAIGYPEELTIAAKATNLKLFSDGAVTPGNSTTANPYGWNWSLDTDNAYENGDMFSITFNVPANVTPGTVYPITIDYDPANVYNVDMDEITFEKIDGSITINGGSQSPVDPVVHTVTFKNGDELVDTVNVEEGDVIGSVPADPEKTGYTFDGWFDGDTQITADTVVNSDITATAKFTEIQSGDDSVSGPEISDKPTFAISYANATPGEEVTLNVSIHNNPGITALQLEVGYPEAFTLVEKANNLKLFSDGAVTPGNSLTANPYGWNWSLDTDNAYESGDMFSLKFKVKDTAYNGDYEIVLSYDPANVYNVDMDEITFEKVNGKITVTGGTDRPPVYNVVVKDADGNELAKSEIDGGNTVGSILPASAPAVEGKDFYRWEDADGNEVTADTVVNADMTITAVYKTKQFSVKFMNGTDVVDDAIVDYGNTVTLPAAPEKEGYNFIGWFEGNTEIKADTVVKANITAEAKFEAKEYNVKFVSFGKTLSESKIKYGEKVYLPATPTAEGHRFNGWADENGKAWSQDTVVTGDMTFTADWTVIKYNVKFVNGTEVVSESEVEYGQKVTLPAEDPVSEGHTFAGWFADGVEVTADTVVGAADITAEAKFDINKYNVIFNSYNNEEVVVVEHGAAIPEDKIPEAAAQPGYNFVKWVLVEDGVDQAEWKEFDFATEITAAIDLFAIYEEIKIDIEVVDADGKAIDTVTVPYGTAIADIAKAIDDAITVNVVEDSEVKEADVKFDALDIKERVATVTIAYGDYSKEINVAYETKDAYIAVENADMLLLYPDYDGKSDDELAKFIYENAGIVVFDEYGIATTQDYTVTFAKDAKDETLATATVTAKYNDKDLEAKEIKVTLQPLGSSSSASGTVVRPSTGVVTGGGSANKPSTDDPATDDPATDDPATDEPSTDDPATDDPATDDPATDDPATDAPATDAPAADVPFTDVKADDWALDAIKDLHTRGIISGDESKALRPDAGITREEVSKIVLNVKGIEVDTTATIDATDAHNVSEWAKGFVATAIKEGLLKGYEDGTVQSGKVVTRAELAAILVRAIGATAEFTASSFTDVGDAWYAAEVECAKNLGIVTGYEDGSFQGDKPVTRREAFAMAQRVIKLIEALENN